ncbi:hypothetical protein V3391_06490 [Luteimonas sp. SMYT11W]|uniref:Uncharacterized protein n=1 Tax=Luteimonas flava TaxID=3115822 RepID=A0ABU7WDY4_9GAMM
MALRLGTIDLPADMRWQDEFRWLPTASQVEVASDGALWIEESAQRAGRPITLESGTDGAGHWAVTTRATVAALHALASEPRQAPLLLELEDGRTFNVRFRHADNAVEAEPLIHIAPHVSADYYHLTLRLMQV